MSNDDRPKPFVQLTMQEANIQCRPWDQAGAVGGLHCPVCTMRVVLHCDECMIQVTGCLCTEEKNHGPEIARERMIQRGIWLPAWGEKPATLLDASGRPIDVDGLHG